MAGERRYNPFLIRLILLFRFNLLITFHMEGLLVWRIRLASSIVNIVLPSLSKVKISLDSLGPNLIFSVAILSSKERIVT